jgi:plastocyanin
MIGEKQSRFALLKRGAALALVGLAVPALIACSGGGDTGASGSAGGGANTIVMGNDNLYKPNTLEVAKGTTVTWDNTSAVQHTVTFDPSKVANASNVALPSGAQPFDSGFIDPKKKYTHTFDTVGTYKYVCIPHEGTGMIGTITVK